MLPVQPFNILTWACQAKGLLDIDDVPLLEYEFVAYFSNVVAAGLLTIEPLLSIMLCFPRVYWFSRMPAQCFWLVCACELGGAVGQHATLPCFMSYLKVAVDGQHWHNIILS